MPSAPLPLLSPGASPLEVDPGDLRSQRAFQKAVRGCESCELAEGRIRAVPGSGAPDADVMIVGLAPGRQEDVQGQPFVGAAGNVLDNALAAAGVGRSDIHMTTLVRCRPPEDREPSLRELEACFGWLVEQVAMVRPTVIVTLGELPTSVLLRRRVPIGRVAGLRLSVFGDIALIPTYDPGEATRGNPRAASAVRGHVAAALELAGVATLPRPASRRRPQVAEPV